MTTRTIAWCLAIGAICAAIAPASAVSVRSWSVSTETELATGTLDGTALDSEGRVRLAPELTTLWGPEPGVVWAVHPAGTDAAFVALSGPGRLIRVRSNAEAATWYESSEETLVTAMLGEDERSVVFGLSPEGTVHRARETSDGEVEIDALIETGSKFVWALGPRSDGGLWIGTGVPGKLLRLDGSGQSATVFDAGDDPVRCMAPLPGDAVVIGTGGRGLVVRIGQDGEPFVLYDADEAEVVSLAVAEDGTIYALAATGPRQPEPSRPASPSAAAGGATAHIVVTPPPNGNEAPDETADSAAVPQAPARAQSFQTHPGGTLYRIDPDGTTRKIWDTLEEMPFGLVLGADGTLVVGTGDAGRVHSLDGEGRASSLLRIPSDQVSALATDPSGRILLGGTTDARVAVLGPGPRPAGSYLSPAVDAGSVAEWGRLLWDAVVPARSGLRVLARSGNTADPDETWSPWAELHAERGASSASTDVPPARWFQARFELRAQRADSPSLGRIEIAFQPRNRPPEVTQLDVEPPGVVWLRGPAQSSFQVGPLVADDPVARRTASGLLRRTRPGGAIRRTYEAGARTLSWLAEDPDEDRLRYSLALRREGDPEWFPLAHDLTEQFHSWDARAMPDGVYRVRLTVDDAPDNPNGTHRHAQRVSHAFRVDNTRPVIDEFEIDRSGEAYEVRFVAHDPGGSVAAVEVAVDGGDWTPLSPLDGVADSELERFRLVVERRGSGDAAGRSLIVRVTDSSGNLGGAMWRVE